MITALALAVVAAIHARPSSQAEPAAMAAEPASSAATDDGPAAPSAPPLQWEWFPSTQPKLAPYLSDLNFYGSECIEPGAIIESDPVSEAAQFVKSKLAEIGITYRLDQAYAFAAMSNVTSGNNTLNYYSMQLIANWVVFNSLDIGGTSGWVSFEANAGMGLGFDLPDESPHQNIGSATWPNYGWNTAEAYISELAWTQSFFDGTFIVAGGMLDQTLILDTNSYANNNYGQLMNWAFVNSQVVPMSFGSLGATIQWQPLDWLYVMYATGANNTPSGRPPWYQVRGDYWSHIGEIGFISEDTLGLGPGVFRVQPFIATVGGETGGGVALNFEQSLGVDSPLGWYGRFGIGDATTALVGGARAQVATGIVLAGDDPTRKEKQAFDLIATGFAWTKVNDAGAVHGDEFAFEVTAFRRITPTLGIQPDLQVIFDPAYSASDVNVIFQLQLVLTW